MMETAYRVLFIEDDPEIGELVSERLRELGHAVTWAQDGAEGFRRYEEDDFDLIILDLRLPSLHGLDICQRIRDDDPFIPIVMLTAKAEKRDVVRGLELGADDYITKPFSTSELIARIRALFRRIAADRDRGAARGSDAAIGFDGLTIYPEQHKVTCDGESVHLTAKEFDLLLLFARHPGRAFSRGELLNEVWGDEFDGFDHTVNTHINRLRNKIEPDPAQPTYIRTVWGVGYRFAEPDELDA
jgi:DNA-binding response OmpR family regulator